MSLEFAGKVREVRDLLGLTQRDLAGLLDIHWETLGDWETLTKEAHPCWERTIQFMLDCPSSAIRILAEKPWIDETRTWRERLESLLKRLGWTNIKLAEFLNITIEPIMSWKRGDEVSTCPAILMSLLEIYADVDPKEWPAAFYFPYKEMITPERIRLLRLGLGMTQSAFGNLIHVIHTNISSWETGKALPGWCGNLLLKVVETFPKAIELLEKIPWADDRLYPEQAIHVRQSLGLTQLELARIFGITTVGVIDIETGEYKGTDCGVLLYRLLAEYPEEFIGYIQGLSSPGGQACPIW